LQQFGIAGTGLKWPNDVMANGAKLAGVLIEVGGEATGPCYVIIGVGVNVHVPEDAGSRIDQPWVDIRTLQGTGAIRRNRLAAQLLEHLLLAVADYESSGLEPFLTEWREYDIAAGRRVSVLLPDGSVTGTGAGVDSSGALLLRTVHGLRNFSTGEVSLRIVS
jgi:BirA family biotin operon repressor/biotin-[acetyl-CoA-carboxylase] ligase